MAQQDVCETEFMVELFFNDGELPIDCESPSSADVDECGMLSGVTARSGDSAADVSPSPGVHLNPDRAKKVQEAVGKLLVLSEELEQKQSVKELNEAVDQLVLHAIDTSGKIASTVFESALTFMTELPPNEWLSSVLTAGKKVINEAKTHGMLNFQEQKILVSSMKNCVVSYVSRNNLRDRAKLE